MLASILKVIREEKEKDKEDQVDGSGDQDHLKPSSQRKPP